jgi:hypothetical protein
MNTLLQSPGFLVILAAANVPILLLMLRFAFDSWEDVGESVVFWLGPLWLQLADVLRGGDWGEHQWDSLKLVVLFLVFVGLVLSEYAFVSSHFPGAIAWANHVLPFGAGASQPGGGGAG